MRSTDTNASKCYFRSSARIFQMNGAWHFSTREGERGPFRSKELAQAGLEQFVQDIEDLRRFQKSRTVKTQKAPMRSRRQLELAERAAPRTELILEMP